jgi:hypothetical protein
MTALLVGLTVAVALLAVLVAGLLRANAEVLRALHQMGVDLGPDSQQVGAAPVTFTAGASPSLTTPRPTPRRPDAADVIDLAGVTPHGDAVSLAVGSVRHDTLIAFLTSGCQTCRAFWDAFRSGVPDVPGGARLVVVTRGPEAESPGTIASLSGASGSAADGAVPVVMSSEVWEHYDVPYAPYFVYVSGIAGRVLGEGVSAGWEEVKSLVANAVADGTTAPIGGTAAGPTPAERASVGRPRWRADRARDAAADLALQRAGIGPGDPRLHPAPTSPAAAAAGNEGSADS